VKNQVLFVIFLFFGFAFLVYLFPVIFVEGAKLQSGVTINAPSTTETEKICDDTIDNDNDGKIDANDEDCAAAPAGPTAETCGLQIVSGVPINYGQLNPGQVSAEKKVVLKNEGTSQTPAKIMIKGGNWISDAAPNPTISGPEITRVGGQPATGDYSYYSAKFPLSGNGLQLSQWKGWELMQISGGQSIPVYFQFRPWTLLPGLLGTHYSFPSGSFHQEVTIDLLC